MRQVENFTRSATSKELHQPQPAADSASARTNAALGEIGDAMFVLAAAGEMRPPSTVRDSAFSYRNELGAAGGGGGTRSRAEISLAVGALGGHTT